MAKLPAITLTVDGAKIELAADSYKREGNLITVPGFDKPFEVTETAIEKKDIHPAVPGPSLVRGRGGFIHVHHNMALHHADMAKYHHERGNSKKAAHHAEEALGHHDRLVTAFGKGPLRGVRLRSVKKMSQE